MDDALRVLGAASMAHLLFSVLLMLSGRRLLPDRSFANAIIFISLLAALASLRFVMDPGGPAVAGLWYDALGGAAGVAATSCLTVIIDHYRGRQTHPVRTFWPVVLWLIAWSRPEFRQSEDLRILVANALHAVNFSAALWAASAASRQVPPALRPLAIVSAFGLACAWASMALIGAPSMGLPLPFEPPMFLAAQAPVLTLACTLPLVLSALLRAFEAQIAVRGDALALPGQGIMFTAQLAKLGEVAAGAAHELRQPLNALRLGLANVARQAASGKLGPAELGVRLASLARYVERAITISEAQRKLACGPSDQPTRFDAGVAVQDALVLLGETARLKGVELSAGIAADLMVMGDPARLEQAIFNLVSNALYAAGQRSPDKDSTPHVDVWLRDGGDEIEIAVADNGPGIAPDIEARLFQAFNTNKPSSAGTGLGLSIVHAIIVTEFHGSITATSSPIGARFVLRIPKAPAAAHHAPPPATAASMAA